MATSKKLTVVSTAPTTTVTPPAPTTPPTANASASASGLFNYWGSQGQQAFQQGWRPVEAGNGFVRYGQSYNAPFNDVYIPETPNERGSIQVIGKNGNKMDIVIADKQGNVRHKIHENVSPDFVQNYISNSQSTVAQRVDKLKPKKLSVIAMR